MFVLNDDFAIKDCGSALEVGGSLNQTRVTVAPIESVAGISAGLTSLHYKERAVSVVLDLVNPTTPQRRLIYECCKLGFDEMEFAIHAGHSSHLTSESREVESIAAEPPLE